MNFSIFLNQTFENRTILRHINFPLNFSIQENRELDGAKSLPIPSYDVKAGNATHHPNLPPFIPQSIYGISRKISTKKCDFILKYIEQSKQREKRCASVYFLVLFFFGRSESSLRSDLSRNAFSFWFVCFECSSYLSLERFIMQSSVLHLLVNSTLV